MLFSELNSTRDERVLRRTIDEWNALKNRGNSKDGRWRNLLVARLDSLEQVVRSVVDALDDVCIALSVGGPLYDDLVEVVGSLEVTTLSSVKVKTAYINARLTGYPCGSAQHGP
jgi:hypothetical protein